MQKVEASQNDLGLKLPIAGKRSRAQAPPHGKPHTDISDQISQEIHDPQGAQVSPLEAPQVKKLRLHPNPPQEPEHPRPLPGGPSDKAPVSETTSPHLPEPADRPAQYGDPSQSCTKPEKSATEHFLKRAGIALKSLKRRRQLVNPISQAMLKAWKAEKLAPRTPPVYAPVYKFKYLTAQPDLDCQYEPSDFLK